MDRVSQGAFALDLGAHRGDFGRELHALTGVSVVAVEANPRLAAALPAGGAMRAVHAAVAGTGGTARLHLAGNPEGSSLLPEHSEVGDEAVEVPATTLHRLVADQCDRRVAVLKVDIEGAEVEMLEATGDELLRGIDQITIEFHDFLPELGQAAEVARARRRLRDLGFGEIVFKSPAKDVLYVNLRRGVMTPARFGWVRGVVRLRQIGRALAKRWAGRFATR